MFGNLFNQKKTNGDEKNDSSTSVVGAEINVKHTDGDDIFGDPGANKIEESIKVEAPQMPTPSLPSDQGSQESSSEQKSNITSSPQNRENDLALSRLDPRATQVLNHAQDLARKNS